MKATRANISNTLGIHGKGILMEKQTLENGFALSGFLSRNALQDLMNNFHVYIAKSNKVIVLTPGRLKVTSRV